VIRVSFKEAKKELNRVLLNLGASTEKAEIVSRIYAESSLKGIYSHGIPNIMHWTSLMKTGLIDVNAEPEKIGEFGGFERWDGHNGLGAYNALHCSNRAIELAKVHGIGCAALRNNSHWGRAGTYSGNIADAGMIGFCGTNTRAVLATWGGMTPKIGSNPISLAVPGKGKKIAVDMALTQFSMGQLFKHRSAGMPLPVDGGYDKDGNITRDPVEILESRHHIPVGFWKGSAFSMLIDLMVSTASSGNSTKDIMEKDQEVEVSQIFMAINFAAIGGKEHAEKVSEDAIKYVTDTELAEGFESVRFPGQSQIDTEAINLVEGIPLEQEIWDKLKSM